MTIVAGPIDKFTVRYDARARRLHWSMRGFWAMADVMAFAVALRAAIAPPGLPPHLYDGLGDSSAFPVQSGEASAALGKIDRIGSAMRTGRLAIVVSGTIDKLQAARTLLSEGVRVFLSRHDAEAWLEQTPTEPA